MTSEQDFEQVAIARDLVRKPEIKLLAKTIASIHGAAVDDDIPPIFVTLAHRLITRPEKKQLLLQVLEIV
jgi:hypothetical protein